jgi:hypothetical protein
LLSVKDRPDYEALSMVSEPCESSCFSAFVNVDAQFFPCSFAEKTNGWEDGLDILNCDIWNHEKTICFRKNLLQHNRECPLYEI